jgi:hypothetical protein
VSAIPSPVTLADAGRPGVRVPAGVLRVGRTAALLALAMLVPGEAARIGSDLGPRR